MVYPQNSPFFGYGDGVRAANRFGDNLGAGKTKILGIFGGISLKIPKFRGGDGERNIGDFPTTSTYLHNRKELVPKVH